VEEVGHETTELEVEFVDVAKMGLCGDGTVLQRGGNGRRQERSKRRNRNPFRACRGLVLEQLGKVEVGLDV
jgi:hypothetical protein